MLFNFNGTVPLRDLSAAMEPLIALLQKEGLECVSDFSISFVGWRGQSRCQVVDQQGWLRTLSINPDYLADSREVELALPEGLIIRDRPEGIEGSPLAISAGRDD